MARRVFSKEFKLEAVKRVRDQSITAAQARRDLGVHEMLMPSNYAPPGLEHALHELLGMAEYRRRRGWNWPAFCAPAGRRCAFTGARREVRPRRAPCRRTAT